MRILILLTILGSWAILYDRDPGSLRSLRNATEFNNMSPNS